MSHLRNRWSGTLKKEKKKSAIDEVFSCLLTPKKMNSFEKYKFEKGFFSGMHFRRT
jgi:hypothetical protein